MTQAKYRIKPGGSFRMPDGSVKTHGDEIDLDSDVATACAAVLEPLPPPEAEAAPAGRPVSKKPQTE